MLERDEEGFSGNGHKSPVNLYQSVEEIKVPPLGNGVGGEVTLTLPATYAALIIPAIISFELYSLSGITTVALGANE